MDKKFRALRKIQYPRAQHHSKRRHRWVGVKGSTRNRFHDPKGLSARCIPMVQRRHRGFYFAVNGAGARHCPPTYNFHRGDWDKFTRQAVITEELVLCREVDDAVLNVTDDIMKAADATIPTTSNSLRKLS
ncbi:hypothetical protein TNCV_3657761 [Trichonephila clavipes]|nr:hypothetical protein TNCV_3657761 [Trichonephila clavipes]